MIEFNPEKAIEILKEAANIVFDHTSKCNFPIFVDKSIIANDIEEREKAFHCERMEDDKLIRQFKELPNGPVYTLCANAFSVIDAEEYPAIADEPHKQQHDTEPQSKSNNQGFWFQIRVNVFSYIVARLLLILVGIVLEAVFDFSGKLSSIVSNINIEWLNPLAQPNEQQPHQ